MASITENFELLSAEQEGRLFWRLRGMLIFNTVRQTLATARLRVSLVLALSIIFWLGLFVLFVAGFEYLANAISHTTTRDQAVRVIYGVFFGSLMVMLVFSTAIVLYGSLYRSREVDYLLTTPARIERIVMHKFHEAMLFSSWGFLLLASPVLLAYGLVVHAPWYYFAMLVPFLVAFVYVPGSLGAVCCMLIVHRLPRRRKAALIVAGCAAFCLALWLGWSLARGPQDDLLTPTWFQDILTRLRFSEHRMLPSWWLSTGILEAARGERSESLMFLSLIVSNALVGHLAVIWVAGRTFHSGYSGLYGETSVRKKIGVSRFDSALLRFFWPLSREMRVLVVKDLRLFRRDPVQWSQFLIFFGLLGLYFLNIRRLSYDMSQATWINMVSFLNLAVVGLILSTFTSRFVFPMISLEGRRFWILGRLPIRRDTILWSKFLFAALGSAVPCLVLVLLSDVMLRVETIILAVHLATCLILCAGLSAIAVGLGAKLPNLREDSPSKIAAGFGGTLNLVLSAIYIMVVVLLTAVPCHFYVAAQQSGAGALRLETGSLELWIAAGAITSVMLGTAATVIPLVIGFRAFRRLEV